MEKRVALITGGTSGLGLAIARELLRHGYEVALLARGASEFSIDTAGLGANASRITLLACDVTNDDEVSRSVSQVVARSGRIDVLINSAGVSQRGSLPFQDIRRDELERMMSVNAAGVMVVTQRVLREMRKKGAGHIVTILSLAALAAGPGWGAYSATKFAARALVESLAEECRNTGIRVSSVSPGRVNTDIWEKADEPPSAPERSRMLQPDDVVAAVMYLLSTPAHVHVGNITLDSRPPSP